MISRVDCNVFHPLRQRLQSVFAQLAQLWRRRLGACQPGVHHLFHGPCSIAKLGEPDHAGTAFECVECTAQGGFVTQAVRLTRQGFGSRQTGLDHISGFFQKNVDEVILDQIILARLDHRPGTGCRKCRQSSQGRCIDRLSRRGAYGGHSRGRFARSLCQRCVVSQRCLLRKPVKANRQIGPVSRACAALRGLGHALNGLLDLSFQWRLGGRHTHCDRPGGRSTHDGAQLTLLCIKNKQLPGQRGLVVQHVDQEAQRTEVVGQATEGAGLAGTLWIDLVNQQGFDVAAHVGDGSSSLIETQHGQHATHLRQLLRHRPQQGFVGGVARKLIQIALQFRQTDLELTHNAAHGLFVTDLAVQHFHPWLQRLRRHASMGVVNPLSHLHHALRQGHVGGIDVL